MSRMLSVSVIGGSLAVLWTLAAAAPRAGEGADSRSGDPPVVMRPRRQDVKPFEYVPAKVPFYPADKPWGVTGKPWALMQKPLEPTESLKHLVTPVELRPQLFAAEPLIRRPICMAWDERGRLWVAESVDYPNDRQPPGQGNDRIVICEDTDGDGVADKITVFADHLSIPTGFTFYKDGLIVVQAPETLFLRDRDGDGRADERHVLFRGWGTHDSHAGPSNLHYGLDNWIYGIVGYSGFRGTVGGEFHQFGQGFFRFKPDGSKLEFLRSTNNNSWGLGFSEEGLLFGSTANGNPSVFLGIPNRYYERVRGWSAPVLPGIAGNPPIHPITDKIRQVDFHGHFTAAAGHALYTARSYPRYYWNRTAFVAEPTGHLVATFVLEPVGAGFRARSVWNLLASDDEWTAPIQAEVGPDGQVWVIDWYNYIVQHNPTPPGYRTGKGNAYETPLRDKTHGRIYRLVAEQAPPSPRLDLRRASARHLVQTLRHENMFWRLHAQRLLVERGQQDVMPDLLALVRDPGVDALGLNPGAIHALWTLHGLGLLDGRHAEVTAAAVAALKHRSAGVRRNAVLVLPAGETALEALAQADLLRDPEPQVRLATLLALADQPASPRAAALLRQALATEAALLHDPQLRDALTSAAAVHIEPFLQQLLAERSPSWVAQPAGAALLERLAEHYARGQPSAALPTLLPALAQAPASLSGPLVQGLARGWPADQNLTLDTAACQALEKLFGQLPAAQRGQLLALCRRWGSPALEKQEVEIKSFLTKQVNDTHLAEAERLSAARQLVALAPADISVVRQLLQVLRNPRTSPELARGLLASLEQSDTPGLGTALLDVLPNLTPSVRPAAVPLLLRRPAWTEALLQALEQGRLPLADLSAAHQQMLLQHPQKALAERARRLLRQGGNLPNADRQKVIDDLMPLTRQRGDPARGRLVFRNHCAKCHRHSGEGGQVGPDLTGMSVHPKSHLLVEILDPSRNIEDNYRQYLLTTRDGRVLAGLLASESKTAIELVDAEARHHVILRQDIEDLRATSKSLMPEGFEKQLSAQDLVDLLEFLTQGHR